MNRPVWIEVTTIAGNLGNVVVAITAVAAAVYAYRSYNLQKKQDEISNTTLLHTISKDTFWGHGNDIWKTAWAFGQTSETIEAANNSMNKYLDQVVTSGMHSLKYAQESALALRAVVEQSFQHKGDPFPIDQYGYTVAAQKPNPI